MHRHIIALTRPLVVYSININKTAKPYEPMNRLSLVHGEGRMQPSQQQQPAQPSPYYPPQQQSQQVPHPSAYPQNLANGYQAAPPMSPPQMGTLGPQSGYSAANYPPRAVGGSPYLQNTSGYPPVTQGYPQQAAAPAAPSSAYPSAMNQPPAGNYNSPANGVNVQQPSNVNYPSTQNYPQMAPPMPTARSPTLRPSIPLHPTLAGPTAVDQLTGQMQNLSTQQQPYPSAHGLSSGGQPVGIIGVQVPLTQLKKAPISPIQPVLDPAYLRVTLNKIPKTSATLQKTKLPFGLTVTPYPLKYKNVSPCISPRLIRLNSIRFL